MTSVASLIWRRHFLFVHSIIKFILNMTDKIVIVGAGVAGVNAATKLVDNGYLFN